jgi:hypothetical protein
LPSFCKTLSQNKATLIIVQDIKAVQYQSIDDHIIHQIHRPISVVNAIEVKTLSFFTMAWIRATNKNTYTKIQKNPISV